MASGEKTEPNVHPMAYAGFNKKTASLYDERRPEYTKKVIDLILQHINFSYLKSLEDISADFLELGSGTGKFTKCFNENLRSKPVKYIATEPIEGFLEEAKRKCPSIETRVCSAENLPFPDSSVGYVIAAQSFHWFASETSLKEIFRVLVPRGEFICVWNHRNISIPWINAANDLVNEYYTDDIPRAKSGKWKKVFESCCKLFMKSFHYEVPGYLIKGDKEFIIDYFMTISVIASRPEDEKNKAREKFLDILNKFHPEKKDTDEWLLPFTSEICGYKKI